MSMMQQSDGREFGGSKSGRRPVFQTSPLQEAMFDALKSHYDAVVHQFKPNPEGADVDMAVPLNRKQFPDFLFELFLDGFSRVRCQRQAEVDLEHSEGEVRSRESIQQGCCCITRGRRRGGKHYKPYQVTETGEWNVVLRVPKTKAFEGKYKLRRKFILGRDKDNNKIFDGYSFEFVRNDEVYCVKMMRQVNEGSPSSASQMQGIYVPGQVGGQGFDGYAGLHPQQQMLLASSFGGIGLSGNGVQPGGGYMVHNLGGGHPVGGPSPLSLNNGQNIIPNQTGHHHYHAHQGGHFGSMSGMHPPHLGGGAGGMDLNVGGNGMMVVHHGGQHMMLNGNGGHMYVNPDELQHLHPHQIQMMMQQQQQMHQQQIQQSQHQRRHDDDDDDDDNDDEDRDDEDDEEEEEETANNRRRSAPSNRMRTRLQQQQQSQQPPQSSQHHHNNNDLSSNAQQQPQHMAGYPGHLPPHLLTNPSFSAPNLLNSSLPSLPSNNNNINANNNITLNHSSSNSNSAATGGLLPSIPPHILVAATGGAVSDSNQSNPSLMLQQPSIASHSVRMVVDSNSGLSDKERKVEKIFSVIKRNMSSIQGSNSLISHPQNSSPSSNQDNIPQNASPSAVGVNNSAMNNNSSNSSNNRASSSSGLHPPTTTNTPLPSTGVPTTTSTSIAPQTSDISSSLPHPTTSSASDFLLTASAGATLKPAPSSSNEIDHHQMQGDHDGHPHWIHNDPIPSPPPEHLNLYETGANAGVYHHQNPSSHQMHQIHQMHHHQMHQMHHHQLHHVPDVKQYYPFNV
eukprot:GDKJ01020311.1.p1 GENE.GDKJ01020311.1~~GDKJ01020311.1.p1  ORF type:complete len:871 (+),score=227.51 GDKJ01020311.1:249-2615(+)